MNNEQYLILGGEKKWGSGKVLTKILLHAQHSNINYKFLSTNGLFFSWQILFKLIKTQRKIIFQPSVARFSILRDLIIFIIFLLFKKKYSLLILCDINFSNFPFILELIAKNQLCVRVFTPANVEYVHPDRQTIFSQNEISQKFQFDETKYKYNQRDIIFVYGNYLTKDKGLYDFLSLIDNGEIKNYLIFGSGKISEKIKAKYNIEIVKNDIEFKRRIEKISKFDSFFYFGSRYDLAPLVIEECVMQNVPICCGKQKKSYSILKNFIGKESFLNFHEVKMRPSQKKIKLITENAYKSLSKGSLGRIFNLKHEI